MESKKFKTIQTKIKKWASGKPENDYEVIYMPEKENLENYLSGNLTETDPIKRLVSIHYSLEIYGRWHYDKFLDLFLNQSDGNAWGHWFEAASSRMLTYSLGYTKPKNTAPTNDSEIACAICDGIFLKWQPYASRITDGFAAHVKSMINPQSVIQYSFELYNNYIEKNKYDVAGIFKKPLVSVYVDLLQNIEANESSFMDSLNKAAEFHLDRSKNSMDYEFSMESDMIIPSELLATLQVRKSLGHSIAAIEHPLVKQYVALFELNAEDHLSDLYKSVRKQIEKEYLQ
jgi:hypothetical protein